MTAPKSIGSGSGLLLGLASSASFSTSGSFARSLTDGGWSPAAAVLGRVAIATLVMLVPAIIVLRRRWSEVRRGATAILLYGLVTVAGCQICYFHAIEHLSVGVALLLEYLGVVFVVGYLWLRRGERPRRLTTIGAAIALAGLVVVIDVFGARVDLVGVLWALGAAVGLATYFVVSAKDDGLPAIALASGGMLVATIATAALGIAGALPMHATFDSVDFAARSVPWWIPVAGVALVATTIPYLVGIGAARRLGPRVSAFLGLTEVVFAILVAWIALGQFPTRLELAGGALILIGVAVVRLDDAGPRGDVAPLDTLEEPASLVCRAGVR